MAKNGKAGEFCLLPKGIYTRPPLATISLMARKGEMQLPVNAAARNVANAAKPVMKKICNLLIFVFARFLEMPNQVVHIPTSLFEVLLAVLALPPPQVLDGICGVKGFNAL